MGYDTFLDLTIKTTDSPNDEPEVRFGFENDNTWKVARIRGKKNAQDFGGSLVIETSAPGDQATNATVERLRIDANGNVGIGTPQPQNRLDVAGSMVIGASYAGTQLAPANGLLVEGTLQLKDGDQVERFSNADLSAASALAVPTQQAVKTYVDAQMDWVNGNLTGLGTCLGEVEGRLSVAEITLTNHGNRLEIAEGRLDAHHTHLNKLDTDKAASAHTHDYAASSHTHDYAPSSHTHDYAPSSHTHDYVPGTGGTITGDLTVTGNIGIATTQSKYTRLTGAKYPNEEDLLPDNLKLVLGTGRLVMGYPSPPDTELAIGYELKDEQDSNTYFKKLFSIRTANLSGQGLMRFTGHMICEMGIMTRGVAMHNAIGEWLNWLPHGYLIIGMPGGDLDDNVGDKTSLFWKAKDGTKYRVRLSGTKIPQ